MDYESFLEEIEGLFTNLRGDGAAVIELADNQRRKIVMAITIGCAHFAILLAVHAVILLGWSAAWFALTQGPPPLYSPLNAIWGTLWILALGVAAVMRGGWAIHGPFFGMILMPTHEEKAPDGSHYQTNAAESVARVYVGFVAIEFIVNMIFNVIPFFGSLLGGLLFVTLLSPVAAYFLIRWLARESINWKNWIKLPLWNIYITVAIIFIQYFRGEYPSAVSNTGAVGWISTVDPVSGIFWAIVVAVLVMLFMKKR